MTDKPVFDLQALMPAISYHVSFREERYCDPLLSPLVIRELRLTPPCGTYRSGCSLSCQLLARRAAALDAGCATPARPAIC